MTTRNRIGNIASEMAAPSLKQAGADADLIGVGGEQVRGVGRSAAGHHVDDLEVGERLDHREQHHDHGHRQQQRPGDVPEPLPGLGAVDGGGLVELGADGLQPGEQADGEERHAAPDVDDDDRDHGEVGIAQPVDAAGDQAELVEQPVEDAEGRIEHPLPGEGRQHGRDDEGQQDEGAGEGLALEIAVEQHREPQAERQLEDGGDARIDEGVVDGRAEDASRSRSCRSWRGRRSRRARPRASWSPTAGCRARTDRR